MARTWLQQDIYDAKEDLSQAEDALACSTSSNKYYLKRLERVVAEKANDLDDLLTRQRGYNMVGCNKHKP